MFERLLERIANALDAAAIPYMVIGGQAVLLYGEPRLTKDIDITLGADLRRLRDVLQAVAAADLKPLVDPDSFTAETMVLPCADVGTGIRIDLIFSSTPYEQQAMSRVRKVKLGAAEVRFASVEDLLIHKLLAGRPRDIEDAQSVLLKNPCADHAYIRRWLGELSTAVNEPLTERFDQLVEDLRP